VRVVEQAIEQRRDGRGVAEQLAPVIDGAIEVRIVDARS